MKKLLYACTLLVVMVFPLFAEIAPEEYRNMQLRAEDHVIIAVRRVSLRRPLFSSSTNVTVKAEVIEVFKSNSNLSIGDQITIAYTHTRLRKGAAGPRSIPILKKGTETTAFIAFDVEHNHYIPVARGASFEHLIRL